MRTQLKKLFNDQALNQQEIGIGYTFEEVRDYLNGLGELFDVANPQKFNNLDDYLSSSNHLKLID